MADRRSVTVGLRWLGLVCAGLMLASCGSMSQKAPDRKRSKEYFSESEYGVKASPRVTNNGPIRSGGGRYLVGDSYVVKGKRYFPREDFAYDKTGVASWYGSAFHGRLTANGEVYDQASLSAAHPTFPLPSYARVTNLETGSSVIVRVNDRGPYFGNRLIDLSAKTAQLLDMSHSGTGKVRVQYVGKAPLEGHDMPWLMASYRPKGDRSPGFGGQIASGVMVASNTPLSSTDFNAMNTFAGNTPTARMPQNGVVPAPTPRQAKAAPMPLSAPIAIPAKAPTPDPQTPFQIIQANGDFVLLPNVGPVPRDRPGMGAYAAAYAEEAVVSAHAPFDYVFAKKSKLTEESVLAAARRMKNQGN